MKIAVVEFPDSDAAALVEVEDGKASVIDGASPSDLIAVALDPEKWPGRGAPIDLNHLRFRSPVERPPSLRDFMAYDAHLINTLAGLGQKPNPAWYEEPVFYFSNPVAVIGDGDTVRRPRNSVKVDYEVEVAAVIGREASDIDSDAPDALGCIAGFTLMNDWSARDLAAREMKHFLGPVKGKDFATSLGPWLVTPDELRGLNEGVLDEPIRARVNGEVCTDSTFAGMTFNWRQILARASANTTLVPGDVIGSGTVGFGCLLELRTKNKELGREKYTFLRDGDVIELESPAFGTLRNIVGPA